MAEPIQDLIGREEFVGKVCALVDGLAIDQHICIAIDGAWGSGKTFVLQMIEEKLKTHDEYFIIRYDAWANSFYDDPLIAILSCIIDELQDNLPIAERAKSVGKELVASVSIPLPEKFSPLKSAFETLLKLVQAFKNPFSKDTEKNDVGEFQSYKDLLRAIKQKLNVIVEAKSETDKQGKLVFLVDEIDRCLPNEQLKTLERLHHLLDIPNCVVICGVNGECIAKTVQSVYGINGDEFQKKYFDFTYYLEMSADTFCKSLFSSFEGKLRTIKNDIEWAEEPVKQAYQCLLHGSQHILKSTDNRSLNRYFDSLQKACNAFGWERLDADKLFFIIVALFIKKSVYKDFLCPEEILANPPKDKTHSPDQDDYQMPFFDYLKKYTGLDRQSIPPEVEHYYFDNLPGFSWSFNAIVSYSIGGSPRNLSFRYAVVTKINPSECKELRDLIIRYGGETR